MVSHQLFARQARNLNKESNLKREFQENSRRNRKLFQIFHKKSSAGTRVSYQTSSSMNLGFNKNGKKELVFGLCFLLGKNPRGKEIQMVFTYRKTVDPLHLPQAYWIWPISLNFQLDGEYGGVQYPFLILLQRNVDGAR